VVNETFGVFLTAAGWIAGAMLLLQIVLAFLIEGDFAKQTERFWCAIDPSVKDATGAFVRAKSFMKREMWVMAVRYLQRAITLQPTEMKYYLALTESYARLERYVQSLHILDLAAQVEPNSVLVENLRGVILELQARNAKTPLPEPTEAYDDQSL
jgi:tetratricopeptide (TPR) repeat protein